MTKSFIRQLLSCICKLVIGDSPRAQGSLLDDLFLHLPGMQHWEMLMIHICINQYSLWDMTWGISVLLLSTTDRLC